MKIVHLCLSNFYINGYSYQENMLAKYHKLMGYEVVVIASRISFDANGKYCLISSGVDYDADIKVIRLDYKKRPFPFLNKRLRRYNGTLNCIEQEKPDIIFIHGTSFGDATCIAKYKKRNPNTIIYADSHADWINSGRNWLSLNIQHKVIWRFTTKIITNISEKVWGTLPIRCDFLREVYKVPQNKIDYLPIGVDDLKIPTNKSEIRARIINELFKTDIDDVFLIVTGGKIDSRKNIHLLMEAVTKIASTKVHLVVFGTVLPDFKPVFENYLNSKIHFVGWCTPKVTMDYMIAADLVCFPGTHSTLWEQAVGLSCPAIFKYWKGIDHINVSGNCELLYKDSVEEIKSIIERFYNDKEYYYSKLKCAKESSKFFYYSKIARQAIGG